MPYRCHAKFIAGAEKLKAYSKYPGVLDRTPNRWSAFAYQHGGSFYNLERTKSTITNPGFVKGVQLLVDLHKNGILEPSVWAGNGDANSLFKSGEIGFHFSGSWNIKPYDDLTFNWLAVPMPKGTDRSAIIGGRLLVSFKDATNIEGAEDFKKFITRDNIYRGYVQKVGALPGKKDLKIDYPMRAEAFQSFQDQTKYISPLTAEWGFTPIATVHPKFMEAVGIILADPTKDIIQTLLPVHEYSQRELDKIINK